MPYAVREALAAFRRAPLLNGLSTGMVALALFVVGLFGIAAHNLRVALASIEERVELVAYLQDDTRVDELAVAQEELLALPEVLDVRFLSKEEALDVAREELPEFREVFSDLSVNPLPGSLMIQLRPGSRTPAVVAQVASFAEGYPFVEEVRFGREWVDKLFFLRRIGGLTATILGAGFASVAALIISTAIRIAIFARREEIYVMKLVGARDGFIRRPFVLEGTITGLLGGLVALGLTYGAFASVDRFLFELVWIPAMWVVGGVVAGGLIGFLASGRAVRRHLREV